MADNLHLVLNKRNNYNLVYEGRAHLLKHTNFDEKQWICNRVPSGCRGAVYTNLEVNTVLRTTPHAETCSADDSLLYRIEKRNTLKRRAGEETKPVPQIYGEECSSASTNLETAGQFPPYKNVKSAMYRSRAKQDNLRELAAHSVWCMDGTFKIVPEWYHQLFTIHVFKESKLIPLVYSLTVRKDVVSHCENFDNLIVKAAALGVVLQPQTVICDFETALIPAVQGSFPGVHVQGCYFHFCQAVLRKVADLGLRSRYLREAETKKVIKMLMATAFLPLAEVPAAVDLLGRDVTGSVAALFQYFRDEWMTPNRMPLWNGSTETLIQQVTSGRVTANDLRVKNNKYEEVQLRITALTAEYDGGTRTMEQFLKAIAYDVPQPAKRVRRHAAACRQTAANLSIKCDLDCYSNAI
ncbi:hypothetical protein T11_17394 [Trichinella zimbabwensis]|uniref:MULE transposase domain-containing protein n=1 Tax=Trichinella zimbabwensis TaxID=268475 RepID=A0A0V1I0F5_9BILA|nr:hypothetical protein T11_17394 [Trichinella zimbabwensis]